MRIIKVLTATLLTCSLHSCKDSSAENGSTEPQRETYPSNNNSGDDDDEETPCGIEDGTHSATVDYYNPNTGYSATYTLDVEVDNCQVVQIDFSNGGYLDGDHIDPADIDQDGDASVEDDQNRSFGIHIIN